MARSVEQMINAAEQEIRKFGEHYTEHLAATFTIVEDLAARCDWEAIAVIAHDIKGQAGTLGWPLLGEMARSLEGCMAAGARALCPEAVRLHLGAMRYCIAHNIIGADKGAEGRRLLGDLAALGDHMRRIAAAGRVTTA